MRLIVDCSMTTGIVKMSSDLSRPTITESTDPYHCYREPSAFCDPLVLPDSHVTQQHPMLHHLINVKVINTNITELGFADHRGINSSVTIDPRLARTEPWKTTNIHQVQVSRKDQFSSQHLKSITLENL